jgi:hypothetical protein
MTCNIEPGVELHFEVSGEVVTPSEVDVQMDTAHYASGKFEASGPEGEVVSVEYEPYEPVSMYIGDHLAHRFYIPENGVKFQNDLGKDRKAIFNLPDAAQILSRGAVSESWGLAALDFIIEQLFSYREDEHNVISGLNIGPEGVFSDEELREIYPLDRDESDDGFIESLFHLMVDEQAFKNSVETLSLDGKSPAVGLQRLAEDYNFSWWVDNEGVLQVGVRGQDAGATETKLGGETVKLKSYNITRAFRQNNAIRALGQYQTYNLETEDATLQQKRLMPIATAVAPGLDGSTKQITGVGARTLDDLELAVSRGLYQEVMADTGGNMVINALASNDTETLAALKPGDIITVDESIEACQNGVVTGPFQIQDVQHRASARIGWEIIIECAQIPPQQIELKQSYYYDPENAEVLDAPGEVNIEPTD